MEELQTVVLTRDLPEHGLVAGDVGAVVRVHAPDAYEVEFISGEGRTVAVATLQASDVRQLQEREILHARHLAHH
jgi:hypothetical protein